MKKLNVTTVMAATAALLLASSAGAGTHAGSVKDVVTDSNGNVVVTANDDCVRTKWDAGHNGCAIASLEMRTVYFDFNSAGLTSASRTKLNELAKVLKNGGVKSIKVVGYADEIGSDSYNEALSKRRANAAANYLKGKGLKVSGSYEVRGLGETSSKSDCEGTKGKEQRACLWRDRRVEVEVVN